MSTHQRRKLFRPDGFRKDVALPPAKRSRSSTLSLADLSSPWVCKMLSELGDIAKSYDLLHVSKLQKIQDESESKYCCRWMNELFGSSDNYTFISEYSIVKKFEILVPFLVSTNMRIDVCAVDNDEAPLLLIEVCSNRYRDTIAHCAVSLIDQLRLIRLQDQSIDSVCGFVLPNTHSAAQACLITIKWSNFVYRITGKLLSKDEVIDEIRRVLDTQKIYSSVYKKCRKDYFMGLSPSDISYLQNIIKLDYPLEQVESAFSILVRNEKYFYKISPYLENEKNLSIIYVKALTRKEQQFPHLVLPTNILFTPNGHSIFQFDTQPHQPLSDKEAKSCLGDFVKQAIRALKELHAFGFAHCDVRLPNFCFSSQYEAMLIDFDKAVPIGREISDNDDPFMFLPPKNNFSIVGLDFKQFGLMIHVLIAPKLEEDIMHGIILSSDPFLKTLVQDGIFNEDLINDWLKSYPESESLKSCKEVISERSPPLTPGKTSDTSSGIP